MQKTAYVFRISDWSSDVCSSDLHLADITLPAEGGVWLAWLSGYILAAIVVYRDTFRCPVETCMESWYRWNDITPLLLVVFKLLSHRLRSSEERRIGQECAQTGGSRGVRDNEKKTYVKE